MISLQRVLLSRTDRLGDVILSTPVATAIKKAYPAIEVYFLARNYTAEILEMHPAVDGIIRIDDASAAGSLSKQLRQYSFDAAVALYPRPALALAFLRAGIPLRVGTGYRWYSLLYNRRIHQHRKHAARHEAEFNLQLLAPLGIKEAKVEFQVRFDNEVEAAIANKLAASGIEKKFVIMHPGSGGSARDWPPEHFAALAKHVVSEKKHQVVLTGHQSEQALTQQIQRLAGEKLIDLTGRLTLKELAALIRRAALFVGNSSGPLHLARMLGTPVIAFYPPITACRPERWGPYGCRADVLMSQQEECFRCRKSQERVCACMRAISVEQAIIKIEEML